jgi:hypothetical protein
MEETDIWCGVDFHRATLQEMVEKIAGNVVGKGQGRHLNKYFWTYVHDHIHHRIGRINKIGGAKPAQCAAGRAN